jgi:hypothetical protein
MSDKEYTLELEKQNDILSNKLESFSLMLDLIKAKVNIVESDFFEQMNPKQICHYVEGLGWTVKYEKTHERFLTRCYLSPHKDAKMKVFMQDLYNNTSSVGRINESIAVKNKEIVSLLARIHKKGELEVIFEILSPNNKGINNEK